MDVAAGVDGCKAGWFYFLLENKKFTFGIAKSIHELAEKMPNGSRLFIDIPIGLVGAGMQGRSCDTQARRLLGAGWSSSVFSAPCRPVLAASDYDEAKAISLKTIGKSLSKQTYYITPKIREVDSFLHSMHRDLMVREVHPELCFWALNKRCNLQHKKKTRAGFEERLVLLSQYITGARNMVNTGLGAHPARDVQADDILDALVALLVAASPQETLQTLPPTPEKDASGLPMEIVYTENPKRLAFDDQWQN